MKRKDISKNDILAGHYLKDIEYVLQNNLTIGGINFTSTDFINTNLSRFLLCFQDINLIIKGNLFLYNLPDISSLSEKIIVQGDIIFENLPSLKNLPLSLTNYKNIRFIDNQHLTTIFSKEQFEKTRLLTIDYHHIYSYKEYYSRIKNTLNKNELLKACIL